MKMDVLHVLLSIKECLNKSSILPLKTRISEGGKRKECRQKKVWTISYSFWSNVLFCHCCSFERYFVSHRTTGWNPSFFRQKPQSRLNITCTCKATFIHSQNLLFFLLEQRFKAYMHRHLCTANNSTSVVTRPTQTHKVVVTPAHLLT